MKYNEIEIRRVVGECRSYADVLKKLGIKPHGNNYLAIKREILKYDIDVSHFLGQGWCKNLTSINKMNIDYFVNNVLIIGSTMKGDKIKKKLFDFKFKNHECEECGIGEVWNNKSLVLHLDHKNGINNDNRLENLRILCPNCHSQTITYAGRNVRKKDKKVNKCECGSIISAGAKSCNKCKALNIRKQVRPELNILINDVKELGFVGTGKKYGVSDNSIRKWIK